MTYAALLVAAGELPLQINALPIPAELAPAWLARLTLPAGYAVALVPCPPATS